MISQINSHEFSGSFWETPSGEKQHKSGKSAWREGLCSGTKRLCGGRRRVSSPGPVFVEDKAKKKVKLKNRRAKLAELWIGPGRRKDSGAWRNAFDAAVPDTTL